MAYYGKFAVDSGIEGYRLTAKNFRKDQSQGERQIKSLVTARILWLKMNFWQTEKPDIFSWRRIRRTKQWYILQGWKVRTR